MSDVISFTCAGCDKAYRVATSYIGREFPCKQCGARLCVPDASQIEAGPNDSRVELGSGGEVMRKMTPSGRQVKVDPTRVFAKQRETSARMVAVGEGTGVPKKSGKGPLIAVVALVVLVGGGATAAFAMGLFGDGTTDQAPAPGTNGGVDSTVAEESNRDRILKQVDLPGKRAADFVALLKEAEEAKLDDIDVVVVARKLVGSVSSESGAGFSDSDLMQLAARMEKLNSRADAETIYSLIINRNRDTTEKSPEYKQAHERLGHSWIDLPGAIKHATDLEETGLVEGMAKLREEIESMKRRSDAGWVSSLDKRRFDEISIELGDAQEKYDTIVRDDPFQLKIVQAKRDFSKEKASTFGHWATLTREPYVFFVQLLSDETEAGAERRLESALELADQFYPFFENELRKPLGMTRSLPAGLTQEQRDDAPYVAKLFRAESYLQAHLRDMGQHLQVTAGTSYSEPGTGQLSMVYKDERTSLGTFIRALISVSMFDCHPHAPVTMEEDKVFRSYSAFFLDRFFHSAISYTSRDTASNTYTFFQNDPRPAATLATWAKPFEKDDRGQVLSFGGSCMTAKDFLTAGSVEEMRDTIKGHLESYDGWTPVDLPPYTTNNALDQIGSNYLRGFYVFLYHWGPDGEPKYRDKFFSFAKADLAGEVDAEDPLPAFNKAFGLDEAGWKQFEADWLTYQTAG